MKASAEDLWSVGCSGELGVHAGAPGVLVGHCGSRYPCLWVLAEASCLKPHGQSET